jgi:hypothetical protein
MFQAKPASRNTHYRAISVVPIAEVLRAKISLPSGIGVRKLLGFIHSFSFRIVLIRRYLAVSMEEAPGGGLLGTLSGVADKVVGGDAGMLVAAVAQIEATNLTVPQIKNIGTALVAYLKENANPEVVTEIVNGIPGLKDHLTHHV